MVPAACAQHYAHRRGLGIRDIWPPPEYVRGKLTKKTVSRACVDDKLHLETKSQQVYSDVMHVDGE
jgi:hypothetical protein